MTVETGVTASVETAADLAIEAKETAEGDADADFTADADIQPHSVTADVVLLRVIILQRIGANFLSKSVIRSVRIAISTANRACLLYTSPSPRD